MGKLPEPSKSVEILSRATGTMETSSAGEVAAYIKEGFTLVSVCATPENHRPHSYSLIWTKPLSETETRIKGLIGLAV
jgi:hypothetical protein